MSDLRIIICNFIAYAILTVFLWKTRVNAISTTIAILWTISAFASILFFAVFPHPFRTYSNLSISALVFIFICFSANLYPISKLKNPHTFLGNENLLKCFAWIICAIGILPFLGNFSYFFTHFTSSISSFGNNYGENFSALSGRIGDLGRYSKYLRLFSPFLLFFFLKDLRNNKLLCFLLCCCSLNSIIGSLNSGARFTMVLDGIYIFCLFLLFKNSLPEFIVKKILFIGLFISSIFLIVFISISIIKMGDNLDFMWMSYTLYAGESFLNFSGSMWDHCKLTNGDNSFFVFNYLNGTYPTELRNWQYLSDKSGLPANIFYTYIGDFYMDFGFVGTLFIIAIITWLLLFFVKKANQTKSIYYYMWIGFLLRILGSGFTYFSYLNGPYELIYTPIVLLVLQYSDGCLEKSHKT